MRLLPSVSPAPVPACAGRVPVPCVSPRPSRRMSTIQNLRRSLIRNWRPVCSEVGAAVLGAKPAPFPSPLPPVSNGAGLAHSWRALLWTCSVPLFCERPAVCSGRLIFSLSLAIPQLKLVTHKSSLRLSSGHSGPVLILSNAAHSSLFCPHLLVADASVWDTFLLGVAFRHVICGCYLLFPSQSGCPPRFKDFLRPASVRVSWCLETSSIKTPFLGWIAIPNSIVSLFIFYILSYLLSKTMGCFPGRLMTSASDHKLFCEVCTAFGYSFDEFVGEKVVCPSYSSAILAPPPEPGLI